MCKWLWPRPYWYSTSSNLLQPWTQSTLFHAFTRNKSFKSFLYKTPTFRSSILNELSSRVSLTCSRPVFLLYTNQQFLRSSSQERSFKSSDWVKVILPSSPTDIAMGCDIGSFSKHSISKQLPKKEENSFEKKSSDYWKTVLDEGRPCSKSFDRPKCKYENLVIVDDIKYLNSSINTPTAHPKGHSINNRYVSIAPKGFLSPQQYVDDGYYFACKHEGCHQRYKHQSSACRHYRNSHKKWHTYISEVSSDWRTTSSCLWTQWEMGYELLFNCGGNSREFKYLFRVICSFFKKIHSFRMCMIRTFSALD